MSNRAARRRSARAAPSADPLRDALVRGGTHLGAGRFVQAEDSFRRAVRHAPRDALALGGLAHAILSQERCAEAAAVTAELVAAHPGDGRGHALRGIALANLGRPQAAIACIERARELGEENADLHVAAGTALHYLGEMDRAVRHLSRAAELAPTWALVHSNLGVALASAGRFADAEAAHGRAAELDTENPRVRVNRALGLLAAGRLEEGWLEWERGLAPDVRGERRHTGIPAWDGSDLAGQRLLVYREQGLGDELIYASCYPDLVEEAEHLVVECRGRLVPLLARTFPQATVRASRDRTPLPPVDCATPAGSVPVFRRRALTDFPARPAHLLPDPEAAARWREWLDGLPGRPVGVSWRSSQMTPTRRGAYPPLDDWGPVFRTPGLSFVCLQYDDSSVDRAKIAQRFGAELVVPPDLDLRDDLDGVAALCSALGLVVVVDNAVAALAGATGVETWVLSPAFGPTALGTDYWPWLPSVRLFERAPGDTWDAAIASTARSLLDLQTDPQPLVHASPPDAR